MCICKYMIIYLFGSVETNAYKSFEKLDDVSCGGGAAAAADALALFQSR